MGKFRKFVQSFGGKRSALRRFERAIQKGRKKEKRIKKSVKVRQLQRRIAELEGRKIQRKVQRVKRLLAEKSGFFRQEEEIQPSFLRKI